MGRTTKTFEERIQMMDQKEQEMSEKLRQYQVLSVTLDDGIFVRL